MGLSEPLIPLLPFCQTASYLIPDQPTATLLEIVGPALLLGPELLVVSARVDFQLDLVCVDNLLATVLALHRITQSRSPCSAQQVNTHDGSGLGSLDRQTVGLHGSTSTGSIGLLLLLVALRETRISRGERDRGLDGLD